MRMYWRPGLRVWWRSDGEAQLGQDPATVMFGLSKAEHVLLDAFAQADPQLDCWTVAMRLGWHRERFAAFIERLPEHALVDSPTLQASPVHRYWSVAQTTGVDNSTARYSSEVVVDGMGPLGVRIVDAMCRAGIDTIYLADAGAVAAYDVHPGGFLTDDVGRPRALAAMHRLRPLHPMARLHADPHPAYLPMGAAAAGLSSSAPAPPGRASTPPGRARALSGPAPAPPGRASTPPGRAGLYAPDLRQAHPEERPQHAGADLAVVIGNGALPARRVRSYENSETPILPVVVRDLDIVIGPLLTAVGPCLRCIHLAHTEEDPRWPALATQMAAETNPGIDPIVTEVAAGIAAHQVVAFADRRPTALVGTSLHVDGIHPVPRIQRWSVHPDCGCQLHHLVA